jgi:hypothetical protein
MNHPSTPRRHDMDKSQLMTHLQGVLLQAWSLASSSKWVPDNPALGQCGVTALVVHDLLGGDILSTQIPGGPHFYNRIEGKRYDFTESQFDRPIVYEDVLSSRQEAFSDTTGTQYNALKRKVLERLKRDPAKIHSESEP